MPANPAPLKKQVVTLLGQGITVAKAMESVGRTEKNYTYWCNSDPDFKEQASIARAMAKRTAGDKVEVPDFEVFCRDYLHQPLSWHQLQWFDLLEGREPRDLHPSETYTPGEEDKLLINTPVEHAKTTTITVNYVVWKICQNPNVRVLLVSKTQVMAKKFLYAIKNRLTHPAYKDLQMAFAPAEGYKATADAWTANMIYIGGDTRDQGEKDPTVEALGIRGHIYGARADLIILDDAIAQDNAHEYDKQIEWIQAEVQTRLSAAGKMLLVGTRVAPQDLYAEIQDPDRYTDGECPWTVLTQPCVLEFADDPKDWVTLWPTNNIPCLCKRFCQRGELPPDENGLYPKWDGRHMAIKRGTLSPRVWALVYMQQQVIEDAVFPAAAVRAAIDGQRTTGPMGVGLGHRAAGMDGLYVVAGLDPAMAENTAAVVLGVDRSTKRRWVLDVFDRKGVTPQGIRDLIFDWTAKYGIHEWRIEKNAFQIFLTQDPEINTFLASRGCLLREHFTGKNKWDTDFGVASMAPLFGQVRKEISDKGGVREIVENGLIGIPSTRESEPCKRLVEQLVTWYPETKNKTDILMALWFAEIRAREIVDNTKGAYHHDNPWLGKRAKEKRVVVNLDQWAQAQLENRQYA